MKVYGEHAGLYYIITDHLGTPQQIVDSAGTVVWHAAYLPFGKAQLVTETITCNLRFPGQYFDAETGLHYNFHRFYNAETGRYMTADPIGLDGGINLYAYVLNDPVNLVDPWGLKVRKIACLIATQEAINTCGASFSNAYDNLMEDIQKCQDYYSPCLWGDRPAEECKPVEHCFGKMGGPSCVKSGCACDEEAWQDLKKETMTPKCKKAIDKVIKYCQPKPSGLKRPLPMPPSF
jgi:RHS repeat-associated protein